MVLPCAVISFYDRDQPLQWSCGAPGGLSIKKVSPDKGFGNVISHCSLTFTRVHFDDDNSALRKGYAETLNNCEGTQTHTEIILSQYSPWT